MSVKNWDETLNDLGQEMASVKRRAELLSTRFEGIHRCAETFKVAFLKHRLQEETRSLARTRGCTSIVRNRKALGTSLGMAAIGLIAGGIVGRDKGVAVSAGLLSFDATIRGLGECAWVVSLGKNLTVAARDKIVPGKSWVTWPSLRTALDRLEREASQGVSLGSLDNLISRLQRSGELVYLGLSEAKPTWVRMKGP